VGDLKRILGLSDSETPATPFAARDLTNKILHTVYMGTENSTLATQSRASELALEISSYHKSFTIDTVVSAVGKQELSLLTIYTPVVVTVFSALCGVSPRYESQGGTMCEDLALQNIQARLRMVLAYLCAQLFPWVRGKLSRRQHPYFIHLIVDQNRTKRIFARSRSRQR
jgi:NAD+ synthase (glutamine-hydrolysing)